MLVAVAAALVTRRPPPPPPAEVGFQPRPGRAVAAAGWIFGHSQNACYSKVDFTQSLIKPIFLGGLHWG